jgi:hypothetical protein
MFLAAQVTTLDKLKLVPPQFWLMICVAIGGLVVLTVAVRHIVRANKIMVTIVAAIIMALVAFNWVYKRNEPKFLTPIVNKIAPFFPSQLDYAGKQAH